MFVSRTHGKTTSTFRINIGQDLLISGALLFVGLWLVVGSIPHPAQHYIAVAIGLLLLMAGFGHGYATLRLIFRRWRAYGEAARKDE